MTEFGAAIRYGLAVVLLSGCRAASAPHEPAVRPLEQAPPAVEQPTARSDAVVQTVAHSQPLASPSPPAEMIDAPPPAAIATPLQLEQVVQSVVMTYPLLNAAYESRRLAAGEQLAAAGAFDLKLKAESNNTPLGFYETYRQMAGLEQPLYRGGNLFAGYRIGRGNFEPWYLERQTNEGGEFKAGAVVPLLQNRAIDPRRVELWQSQWARRAVEPAIQAEVLLYVYEASLQYWEWVAAGLNQRIAQEQLDLASERQSALERQAQAGGISPIELVDNRRLIVSRQAKLIETRQKLEQAAVKLSLYFRNEVGLPVVPPLQQLPASFPVAQPVDSQTLPMMIERALQNRPELSHLAFTRRQLEIDLAQARNLALPEVDAYVTASQDTGEATSPKRDKSPFELETGFVGAVPLQRRKATGKTLAAEAKLTQLAAKRRFTIDKIANEVGNAQIALNAAQQRIIAARQATELAQQMAVAERRRLAAGDSDLLSVNLREQQLAEAALTEVQANLDYFEAAAATVAATGQLEMPGR